MKALLLFIIIGQLIIIAIWGYCAWKLATLKAHVNSRMDDLIKRIGDERFEEGKEEGRNE